MDLYEYLYTLICDVKTSAGSVADILSNHLNSNMSNIEQGKEYILSRLQNDLDVASELGDKQLCFELRSKIKVCNSWFSYLKDDNVSFSPSDFEDSKIIFAKSSYGGVKFLSWIQSISLESYSTVRDMLLNFIASGYKFSKPFGEKGFKCKELRNNGQVRIFGELLSNGYVYIYSGMEKKPKDTAVVNKIVGGFIKNYSSDFNRALSLSKEEDSDEFQKLISENRQFLSEVFAILSKKQKSISLSEKARRADSRWKRNLELLADYYNNYHSLDLSSDYLAKDLSTSEYITENLPGEGFGKPIELGKWFYDLKRQFSMGTLSPKQIADLHMTIGTIDWLDIDLATYESSEVKDSLETDSFEDNKDVSDISSEVDNFEDNNDVLETDSLEDNKEISLEAKRFIVFNEIISYIKNMGEEQLSQVNMFMYGLIGEFTLGNLKEDKNISSYLIYRDIYERLHNIELNDLMKILEFIQDGNSIGREVKL